ncbi:unnamed protein product [Tetraodon nigroviridis]|uniref:Chromosome 3 SCAF14593, whole genome shotgun sequence n=1 Tax=Tetraodon nigroviridis TaxID=99883 RepID=Q4SGN3_TETNG|nr:unnamed protein product [Tetraodon nigroviridis]
MAVPMRAVLWGHLTFLTPRLAAAADVWRHVLAVLWSEDPVTVVVGSGANSASLRDEEQGEGVWAEGAGRCWIGAMKCGKMGQQGWGGGAGKGG